MASKRRLEALTLLRGFLSVLLFLRSSNFGASIFWRFADGDLDARTVLIFEDDKVDFFIGEVFLCD